MEYDKSRGTRASLLPNSATFQLAVAISQASIVGSGVLDPLLRMLRVL